MVRKFTPQTESLIVVAEQSGQMQVRDFELDPLSNNRIEQKLHLINALQDLAAAKLRDGFITAEPATAKARYGDRSNTVITGAKRNIGEYHTSAEESFKKASKYHEISDQYNRVGKTALGWVHPLRVHRPMYSDFLKRFYTAKDCFSARRNYRKQLIADIDEMANWPHAELEISQFNRTIGQRQHAKDIANTDKEDVLKDQLSELDSRQRLEVIALDARAGFLPKNSSELSQITSWLDYLDNPDKLLGINNQLGEVFIRGRFPTRKSKNYGAFLGDEWGVRAVESIAWEVGDYLIENETRLLELSKLAQLLQEEGRPSMTLFELFNTEDKTKSDERTLEDIFGENWYALATVVQYMDLLEFVDTGEVKGLESSPLLASEDPPGSKRPKFSAVPGKRKTIYNHYTTTLDTKYSQEFRHHITARLKSTTVATARKVVPDSIDDLQAENRFLRRRMNEISHFDAEPTSPITHAVYYIRDQIEQLR